MAKVALTENGLRFIFVTNGHSKGVRVLNKDGLLVLSMKEIISMEEPEIGKKIRFSHDVGIGIDEYESLTNVVKIEIK